MNPFYFTILQQCQVDSDCGAERCCSVFETCHDKRGLDQSCNFVVSENYVIEGRASWTPSTQLVY